MIWELTNADVEPLMEAMMDWTEHCLVIRLQGDEPKFNDVFDHRVGDDNRTHKITYTDRVREAMDKVITAAVSDPDVNY